MGTKTAMPTAALATAPTTTVHPTPGRAPRRRSAPARFAFDFHPLFRVTSFLFLGISPRSAWVEVDGDHVEIRFGVWHMVFDRSDIEAVSVTGPYRPWKVIGPPHLSLDDEGITFGTNAERGVCIRLLHPVRGLEPTGLLRHPGITVTVADVDGLVAALRG
jgi:hypothetical protein